jgi:hypothetical protein
LVSRGKVWIKVCNPYFTKNKGRAVDDSALGIGLKHILFTFDRVVTPEGLSTLKRAF